MAVLIANGLLSASLLTICASALSIPQYPMKADSSNSNVAITKPSGNILHITDMHIDSHYKTHSPWIYACHHLNDPTQTNKLQLNQESEDLTVLDKTEKRRRMNAGRFGSPTSGCDSPMLLINETFRFIHNVLSPQGIDFVIWTGDTARHDNDPRIKRTDEEIITINKLAVEYMTTYFRKIPVVPNVGNNDLFLHNNLEYTGVPIQNLQQLRIAWGDLIPKSQRKQFDIGGWFYKHVGNGVSVVSLNTMYFFKSNGLVGDCGDKSSGGSVQLQWLTKVLKRSRKFHEAVFIIGHVPPTLFNYYPECYQNFSKIVTKYNDVVRGQMYGHMNIDHFLFPTKRSKADTKFNKKWRQHRKGRISEINPTSTDDDDFSISNIYINGATFLQLYWKYLMYHYQSTLGKYKISFNAINTETDDENSDDDEIEELYYEDIVEEIESSKKETLRKLPSVVFVSPSVIPTFNPSLRVFQYSTEYKKGRRVGDILGYTQYYSNLTYWNELDDETVADILWPNEDAWVQESVPCFPNPHTDSIHVEPWKKKKTPKKKPTNPPHLPDCKKRYIYEVEYTPKEEYGLDDMTPAGWLKFAKSLSRRPKIAGGQKKAKKTKRLRKKYANNMVVRTGMQNFYKDDVL